MPTRWTRRRLLRVSGTVGLLGVAGCVSRTDPDDDDRTERVVGASAHQYSSPGCRCCGRYASYLRDRLEGELTESVPDDSDAVKRTHGVPVDLQSCHTVVFEDFVVEGHVPVEAIGSLLEERPAIDGIALPGMPSGSPGMPGHRSDPLIIYSFDDGESGGVYHTM